MDAVKMLTERRSIRKYKDEIVPKEVMAQIVEVAKYAPSWANYQITRYTFVTDPKRIEEIAQKGVKGFAYNMKTLEYTKNVAVLSYVRGKSGKLDWKEGDYTTNKKDQWEMFDVGIACQTFCLAAHEKGIGTCIFGVIDDEAISKILKLPEEETVAAVVTYGFSDEIVTAPPRKDTEAIVRYL